MYKKLLSALLCCSLLTACGESPEEGGTANNETSSSPEICLVSGFGGLDDKAFNQSAHEGLKKVTAELGLDFAVTEPANMTEYEPSYDAMLQEGCKLLIGMSYLQAPVASKKAVDNPDVHIALIDSSFFLEDGTTVEEDNARPLEFDTAQAAFLAGYASASVSKTRTIGTFGGTQEPPVLAFMDGFTRGANLYNEEHPDNPVKVLGWDIEKRDGTFAGTYEDISQGQALTEAMFNQGADIVMPVAGSIGSGAASAAQENSDKYVVWVDSDGPISNPEFKDVILTSVIKNIGASVEDTVKDHVEGNFDSAPYVGTLENNGVDLGSFYDHEDMFDQETLDRLQELEEQIISNEISVDSPYSPGQ